MVEQMLLFLVLVVATVGSQIVQKVISDRMPSPDTGMLYLYGPAFVMALVAMFFTGLFTEEDLQVGIPLLALVGIGAVNTAGHYFQWRAYYDGLAKSALMLPFATGLAVILALVFLGEAETWNPLLAVGMLLCVVAMPLIQFFSGAGSKESNWLWTATRMVLLIGLAAFLLKLASGYTQYTQGTFLAGFFGGAALFSLGHWSRQRRILHTGRLLLLVLGGGIVLQLTTLFILFRVGWAASVVLPAQAFFMILVSALLGLVASKEREQFRTGIGRIGLGVAGLGAVIIILNL
jgi:hypothetical protein